MMIEPLMPERFRDSMRLWITHGVRPGSFLQAVLRNDLTDAIAKADAHSLAQLPSLVCWLYNEMPRNAWGSPEICDAWAQQRREARRTLDGAR